MMNGAVFVAIAASMGNMLQGWDNANIAGSILYIKREFNLESQPTIEGLIIATSLIGAILVTTISGFVSDRFGRRPALIASSLLFFGSSLVLLVCPNIYILFLARLVDGFGLGLAVTLTPIYVSETAPPDIRGLLSTISQFTLSLGMLFSYSMIFGMSLTSAPDWRYMLGGLLIPSFVYFVLMVFFIPESPRWLVSKGKMLEAKLVLQRLRGCYDVSGEMALLVEGLEVGADVSIEKYVIGPAITEVTDERAMAFNKDQIKLYGAEQGLSWVARPVTTGHEAIGAGSLDGSLTNQSTTTIPFMDPMVTLFGSVQENMPEASGSMKSMLFPNFGSMFTADNSTKPDNRRWDEESVNPEDEEYASDVVEDDDDDDDTDGNIQSPLLSRHATLSMEQVQQPIGTPSNVGETLSSTNIGGGWQLAWKWSEEEVDRRKEGGLKRIYMHQESGGGATDSRQISVASFPPESGYVQASALVSQSAIYSKDRIDQNPAELVAMLHPAEPIVKGPRWSDLFESGVKHALIVGIGIQMFQQFAGINGILYYTPQILEDAGVEVLLSSLGVGSDSTSILISAVSSLLTLPFIAVAMRLIDISGRRVLLLATIPFLVLSLIILIISNTISMSMTLQAILSTFSVILYFCFYVMGFGPVPTILCSEMFPTRVRGVCIAICSLTYWTSNIIVTYSLPVLLNLIGLAAVCGIYATVCVCAMVFVYLKVPETMGMPLEVIAEFFSVGTKKKASVSSSTTTAHA